VELTALCEGRCRGFQHRRAGYAQAELRRSMKHAAMRPANRIRRLVSCRGRGPDLPAWRGRSPEARRALRQQPRDRAPRRSPAKPGPDYVREGPVRGPVAPIPTEAACPTRNPAFLPKALADETMNWVAASLALGEVGRGSSVGSSEPRVKARAAAVTAAEWFQQLWPRAQPLQG